MRNLLIRILKHGLPTALTLAFIGFLLGEVAGIWVQGQTIDRPGMEAIPNSDTTTPTASQSDRIADAYRNRLPIALAAWGFGLVVVFELLLVLVRGNAPTVVEKPATECKDSTEELLNELMEKAEAAEMERRKTISPQR